MAYTGPELVVTRRKAGEGVKDLTVRTLVALGASPAGSAGRWTEQFVTGANGRWARPQSWPVEGLYFEPKAGWGTNPWYGCFPSSWWDDLWREQDEGSDIRRWYAYGKALRKIGMGAILACQEVWRNYCAIWAAEKRGEEAAARHALWVERREKAKASRAVGRGRQQKSLRLSAQQGMTEEALRREAAKYRILPYFKIGWASQWSDAAVVAWGRRQEVRRQRQSERERKPRGLGKDRCRGRQRKMVEFFVGEARGIG